MVGPSPGKAIPVLFDIVAPRFDGQCTRDRIGPFPALETPIERIPQRRLHTNAT